MDFQRLAATCGASTRSCSLSHFLASLRVLILPSLVAMKYSSPSTSGRRYLNRLKTYFSASAGGRSSVTVSPPIVQLLQEAVEVEGVAVVHGGLDVLQVFPHGGVRGLRDHERRPRG